MEVEPESLIPFVPGAHGIVAKKFERAITLFLGGLATFVDPNRVLVLLTARWRQAAKPQEDKVGKMAFCCGQSLTVFSFRVLLPGDIVFCKHQSPSLWVTSALRVLHRSLGGLVVDSAEEVRWEEVVEVMREVREVVGGAVGYRPSQPAANPTADTVSHPRPTPFTDSQAYGRHRPCLYLTRQWTMAAAKTAAFLSQSGPPPPTPTPAGRPAPAPAPALLPEPCRSNHRTFVPTGPSIFVLI